MDASRTNTRTSNDLNVHTLMIFDELQRCSGNVHYCLNFNSFLSWFR